MTSCSSLPFHGRTYLLDPQRSFISEGSLGLQRSNLVLPQTASTPPFEFTLPMQLHAISGGQSYDPRFCSWPDFGISKHPSSRSRRATSLLRITDTNLRHESISSLLTPEQLFAPAYNTFA